MAARAIVGIALGMLFLPVIYLFAYGSFWPWITSIADFNPFLVSYIGSGVTTMIIPLIGLFDGTYTIDVFLMVFAISIMAWTIIGMWAGAIERSPGRGIGVAVGIWLGWLIIQIIVMVIDPTILGPITGFLDYILAEWFALVIAIIFAAIFGAMTKSEEF
jgi:hypothetical protein